MFALIFIAAHAQEFRGTISGSVTDAQGAAIPKVKIAATEAQTCSRFATVSDASGEYTLPFLAPGEYKVTTELSGFRRFVQEKLTVDLGGHQVLDIHMQVGDASQSINVANPSMSPPKRRYCRAQMRPWAR